MIPFVDLKAQYLSVKDEVNIAIQNILDSTDFVLGKEVQAFEEEFAGYCDQPCGVAVNSGTAALHLALLACGVGQGDEVITTPHTFFATAEAISLTGARPVFVDIREDTYCIDPDGIEGRITERTRAIIPVHLYGQPADMDPITDIAKRHNLVMIEDACQAHGALYKGRKVGSIGDMSCFSFYPGKNLGAYGEGGIVVTGSQDYTGKIRMLRNHGQPKKYYHDVVGLNYRMEGIQGAILRVKLKHLDEWTEARRRNAALYNKLLAGVPHVVTPRESEYAKAVYHLYVIRTDNRDGLAEHLASKGISTGIHYPIPVHLQKAYSSLGFGEGDYPITEKASKEILSLPMYPELKEEEISSVAEAIKEFVREGSGSRR